MEEKTKKYIEDNIDWIQIQINTIEFDILPDIKKSLKQLRKVHKKVISKL